MALGRRVMTLFERRGSRGPGASPAPGSSDPQAPREARHHTVDERRRVSESTLEAMFAYQDELDRAVPRQRRGAGRH